LTGSFIFSILRSERRNIMSDEINMNIWSREHAQRSLSLQEVFDIAVEEGLTHVNGPDRLVSPKMGFTGSADAMGRVEDRLKDTGWKIEERKMIPNPGQPHPRF
jgi:hypothetical protein